MRAHQLDQALFDRVAAAYTPAGDSVLPRLSRAADHGLLWWSGVPMPRQQRRQPATTSFPSGHSASAALAAGLPLAVFPAGTLDHFARDAGLSELGDAVAAVERGHAAAVDVAWVEGDPERPQGRIFLNTSSLGSYPELVAVRERLERRIGKWPAMVIGTARVLRRSEPLDLEIDGEHRRLWLLFAGNCAYRPAGFAPTYRPRLDDQLLDVRLLDAAQPFARIRLVLALLSGRLGQSRAYEERPIARLQMRSRDGDRLDLARDGEIGTQPAELTRSKHPKRLVVYRPLG